MPRPAMSRFRRGNSTVPTAECHASSVFLAPFGGQGITPIRIQVHLLRALRISFRIFPIVIYSSQACCSAGKQVGQVGLVGCTYDWHNHHSSRKLILRIPPPIACVHLTVYSATFQVCKGHQFKIEVRWKLEMCQKELYTTENIPLV